MWKIQSTIVWVSKMHLMLQIKNYIYIIIFPFLFFCSQEIARKRLGSSPTGNRMSKYFTTKKERKKMPTAINNMKVIVERKPSVCVCVCVFLCVWRRNVGTRARPIGWDISGRRLQARKRKEYEQEEVWRRTRRGSFKRNWNGRNPLFNAAFELWGYLKILEYICTI